jgi:hypothetical protein
MGAEDEVETMLSQMNTRRESRGKIEPLLPQSTRDETDILGVKEASPAPAPAPPAPAPAPVAADAAAPPPVAEEPSAVEPPAPNAEPVIIPQPAPQEDPLIKTRETVHRPPLPQPGLYDAYTPKPPPLARKPLIAEEPSASISPQEDRRMVKPEALPVSNAEALAALEAWSALAPKHSAPKRSRNRD